MPLLMSGFELAAKVALVVIPIALFTTSALQHIRPADGAPKKA